MIFKRALGKVRKNTKINTPKKANQRNPAGEMPACPGRTPEERVVRQHQTPVVRGPLARIGSFGPVRNVTGREVVHVQ